MKYPDLSPKILNAEWHMPKQRPTKKEREIAIIEQRLHDVRNNLKMSCDPRKIAYWESQVVKYVRELAALREPDTAFVPAPVDESAPSILSKAAGHLSDRAVTYDKPDGERSMARTVELFNLFYGTKLTEDQGWRFMVFLKMVRSTQGDFKLDNHEDAVAYEALAAEFLAKQDKADDAQA